MKEHGDELNFDILSEMDHLHCCVKEALRLHPPLIMLMRYCHKAFTVRSRRPPPASRPDCRRWDPTCPMPLRQHRGMQCHRRRF